MILINFQTESTIKQSQKEHVGRKGTIFRKARSHRLVKLRIYKKLFLSMVHWGNPTEQQDCPWMWSTLHCFDRLEIAVLWEGKGGFWRQAGHQLTGTYRNQRREQQHLETPLKRNQRKSVLQEARAHGHHCSSLFQHLKKYCRANKRPL